jgi:hypothetical protein
MKDFFSRFSKTERFVAYFYIALVVVSMTGMIFTMIRGM